MKISDIQQKVTKIIIEEVTKIDVGKEERLLLVKQQSSLINKEAEITVLNSQTSMSADEEKNESPSTLQAKTTVNNDDNHGEEGNEELIPVKRPEALLGWIKEAMKEVIKPMRNEIKEALKEAMREEIVALNKKLIIMNAKLHQAQMIGPPALSERPKVPLMMHSPAYNQVKRGWGLPNQGKPKSPLIFEFPKDLSEQTVWPQNTRDIRDKRKPEKLMLPKSNPAYDLARRCQGFHPITSVDIEKVEEQYSEITDDEERFQLAGKQCIRDFLRTEMNVSQRVARDIRIKNVFYPKAGMVTAILYAEFETEEETDIVKRNAKFLRTVEGHRSKILPYIPQSLFLRYKAVEEIAFQIRKSDSSKTTRIWITNDFELRVRERGSETLWSHIAPEMLPPLPPQAPRKAVGSIDMRDQRRPHTPFVATPQTPSSTTPSPNHSASLHPAQSIHSLNIYNNLKETEA